MEFLEGLYQFITDYGIWAGLFIYLFIRQLKESKERETAMQNTLDKFADVVGDKLDTMSKNLNEVKADVEDIKDKIK